MHGKVKFVLGMVPTKTFEISKQMTQINEYLVKVRTFDPCMTII